MLIIMFKKSLLAYKKVFINCWYISLKICVYVKEYLLSFYHTKRINLKTKYKRDFFNQSYKKCFSSCTKIVNYRTVKKCTYQCKKYANKNMC